MHYSRFMDSQKHPARSVRRGNDKRALPDFSGSFRDALPAHFLEKKNQGLFSFQYGTTASENESCHCLHERRRELPGALGPAGPPHLTSAGLYFSRRQRREGGGRLGWTRWTAAPAPTALPALTARLPPAEALETASEGTGEPGGSGLRSLSAGALRPKSPPAADPTPGAKPRTRQEPPGTHSPCRGSASLP